MKNVMANKKIATILSAFALLVYIGNAEPAIMDITQCGAKPDGDITEVLLKVWKDACASPTCSKIVIPKGTWKLGQIELLGPNTSPIELCVQGTLEAPQSLAKPDDDWITIRNVDGFDISGGGVFDGQGQQAWKENDCATNAKSCKAYPSNLSFFVVKNSHIHDVTSKDSKYFHINLIDSCNVTFEKVTISAPEDSPNTDGMHLARSSNVNVYDTTIQTGDDCISIGDHSQQFNITRVSCGPGHGISIGSLGKYQDEKDVTGIYVNDCTFKGTLNGVRVKSIPSSPIKLSVSKLYFQNLIMDNVAQPIIIDQEYCPNNQCNLKSSSLVQISDVFIENINGTSSAPDAVILACSKAHPCQNVNIANVDIKFTGGTATSKCSNVKPTIIGDVNVPLCQAPATKLSSEL